MPTPIDPKRLPALKKALASYGENDTEAQRKLAEIYGVANSRFTTLVKTRFPEFPTAERQPDKSFRYPARAALTSMVAYMQESGAAQRAKARAASALMGYATSGASDAPPPAPDAPAEPTAEAPRTFSPADFDRMAAAQTKVWKLAKDQGLYTLTSEVHRIARGVNSMLSREIMNMVNNLDPNGELPPLRRQALTNKCRDIVLKMHALLERFLEDDDDVRRDAGAAGSRNGSGPDYPGRRLRKPQPRVGEAA